MRLRRQHVALHSSRLFAKGRSSSTGARRPRQFPTLAQFLLRTRVIALYRAIVRSTNRIPSSSSTRSEMKQFAREEFERHRTVTDESKIRYLLSTGKTEFGAMERYVFEQVPR
ncbi:MAG: hypothetical protein Q9173_003241 [Seirophora scorigena]